jgi:hypothetical protein
LQERGFGFVPLAWLRGLIGGRRLASVLLMKSSTAVIMVTKKLDRKIQHYNDVHQI